MHGSEIHDRQCQEGFPPTPPNLTALKALDLVHSDNLEAQEMRAAHTLLVHVTLLAHLRENSKPNSGFVLGNTKQKKNLVSTQGLMIRT